MKENRHRKMRGWIISFLLLISPFLVLAQGRVISGKVQDAKDKGPLPGVTVQVRGTSTIIQTGADGGFRVEVPSNATALVFSFVGYEDQVVAIGNSDDIVVSMSPGAKSLEDVVVIGYGTARKSDLTGAVGSVKAAQLQERPAASLNQALAGRIAGVQVNTNSGRPGGQTNVRIRGFSSIQATSNPLYIVDGVALPIGSQSSNSNSIDFI